MPTNIFHHTAFSIVLRPTPYTLHPLHKQMYTKGRRSQHPVSLGFHYAPSLKLHMTISTTTTTLTSHSSTTPPLYPTCALDDCIWFGFGRIETTMHPMSWHHFRQLHTRALRRLESGLAKSPAYAYAESLVSAMKDKKVWAGVGDGDSMRRLQQQRIPYPRL